MGFQDSVAQSLTGNGGSAPDLQAQTGRPDPTMPQPAVPPAPSAGAPTSATTVPAPTQPQPAQPEPQLAPLIHPQHRSMFGAITSALIGGTLGTAAKGVKALAGPAPVDYSVDASGKTVATPRTDTTSSRLQRIALAALEGLSAGSRVPSGPNRGAQWGAGIGAGAEAAIQRQQQQDLVARRVADHSPLVRQWPHGISSVTSALEAFRDHVGEICRIPAVMDLENNAFFTL